MSKHHLTIIDFAEHGQSIFIVIEGFDGETNQPFAGEVKVLGNRIYGDLIHPKKSCLSVGCRQFIEEGLLRKIQNQEL